MKLLQMLLGAVALASVSGEKVIKGQQRPKIVDGQPAPPGRYPYMAGLKFSASSTFPGCGGTLIAPNLVLSAGHCAGPVRVIVGCYDVTNIANEPSCETFTIAQQLVHPQFSDANVPINDFMILRLNGNSANTPIKYIATPGFDIPVGYDMTVMGWGRITPGGAQSPILLEVDVDYLSNEDCEADYAAVEAGLIDASMLCGARPGKDSCQGDSGGPIFARCDLFGEDIHLGTVSWGIGCADPGFPGVYGRTSTGFAFIQGQMIAQGVTPEVPPPLTEFCTIGGTFAPTLPTPAPTPRPTVPSAWVCNPAFFGTLDGCDCECGIPDPDCLVPGQTLFGCSAGEVCSPEGFCVGGEYEPTSPTTPSPTFNVPAGWICNPAFFGTHDGCDCECGAVDPDCEDEYTILFNCAPGQTCSDEGLCVGGGVPPEWTCNPAFFGTHDGCDCECGAVDPDCEDEYTILFGCSSGEVCVDGHCVVPGITPTASPHGPVLTLFPTVSVPTPELTQFPTPAPVTEFPTSFPILPPTTPAPTGELGTEPPSFIEVPEDIDFLYVAVGIVVGAVLAVGVVFCCFGKKKFTAATAAAEVDKKMEKYQADAQVLVSGKGPTL